MKRNNGKKKLGLSHLLMFCLLSNLFCVFPIFAYTILIPTEVESEVCETIAVLLQFLFLGVMAWMNAYAFNTTKMIYSKRVLPNSIKCFKFYALYGFGTPLLCSLITVLMSKLNIDDFQVFKYYPTCFLQDQTVSLCLFFVPIYIFIISNFAMFVMSVVKVAAAADIQSSDKSRNKKKLITIFKLTVCLGAGWVLLFLAYLDLHPALWRVFQVFIELQGVLVVTANMISWNYLKKLAKKKKKNVELRVNRPLSISSVEDKGHVYPNSTESTSV